MTIAGAGMPPVVLAIVLGAHAAMPAQSDGPVCADPASRAVLGGAAARLQAFDDRGAAALLDQAADRADCPDLAVARAAVDGWVQARALAPKGGDPAALAPVNDTLRALERVKASAPRSAITVRQFVDYAVAAVRAAVAAAQDERPEMQLFLEYARDVAATLTLARRDAEWPLPLDELEGELWLEVDRYVEARAAFERAATPQRGARAVVGLARTLRHLDDPARACAAFRQAENLEMTPESRHEVRAYLSSAACNP